MLARWQMSYPEGGQLYHVARSNLYQSFIGTWAAGKFVGDLGWSSFCCGEPLCPVLLPSVAFGNWSQHVDVQSGARLLWRGAFGPGQGSNRDVPKVFARQLVCLSMLSELVCLVQWHAWPVVCFCLLQLIYVLELSGFSQLWVCSDTQRGGYCGWPLPTFQWW